MRTRVALIVVLSLCLAWLVAYTLRSAVADLARVTNESMLPYLEPGRLMLISRFSPCFHLPFMHRGFACSPCSPGEAYVFRHPGRSQQRLVKFAVSEVEFGQGRATLSTGDIISFTQRTPGGDFPGTTVKSGEAYCYFVGSNSERSVDSRDFGPVPASLVEGKVMLPRPVRMTLR